MLRQARILIVEDDVPTVEALSCILESKGFEVATASNGRQALEVLRNRAISLVLLDLRLPVMNGQEFLNRKKKDPAIADVPVIVITGEFAPDLPKNTPMLRKPVELSKLLSLLQTHCAAPAAKTACNLAVPIKRGPVERSQVRSEGKSFRRQSSELGSQQS
jgi:CheY-like chemotaxis protein